MRTGNYVAVVSAVILGFVLSGCSTLNSGKGGQMYKKYQVQRAKGPVRLDGKWDQRPWQGVEALQIKNFTGAEPDHKPKTLQV